MIVALSNLIGAGRGEADDVRLAQAAGGGGDSEVTILSVSAQAVGLEVFLVQVADGEVLRRVDLGWRCWRCGGLARSGRGFARQGDGAGSARGRGRHRGAGGWAAGGGFLLRRGDRGGGLRRAAWAVRPASRTSLSAGPASLVRPFLVVGPSTWRWLSWAPPAWQEAPLRAPPCGVPPFSARSSWRASGRSSWRPSARGPSSLLLLSSLSWRRERSWPLRERQPAGRISPSRSLLHRWWSWPCRRSQGIFRLKTVSTR